MQVYKILVKVNMEYQDSLDIVIYCNNRTDIVTAACNSGIRAPYSCRIGACSTCVALVEEGIFLQKDQSFLNESQIASGYILTCVAIPLSDAIITLNKEMDLYE